MIQTIVDMWGVFMWFWPTPDRGSLAGFSGAELPIVIAIALMVFTGAIVYWINQDEDSPGLHVFRFFWKLFTFLGLPALAISNWTYNANLDMSWLLFSTLLTLAAITGSIRVLLGKRFDKAKPIASSVARYLNVLLIVLTLLAGFNMINELPLNESIYTLLIALAAIATFSDLVKARKEFSGQNAKKFSELNGLTTFAAIFFALVIGLLIQFVVRRLDLDNVWQSVTFWIVLVLELAFNALMLLTLVGNSEETNKKSA